MGLDFKRHAKGFILDNNLSIDLVADRDNGALFLYQGKIKSFLSNTIQEILSVSRGTTTELESLITANKVINGDMVFNTTENTYQQVIGGQLVSFGTGGGSDPALEGRVETLESQVTQINSDISQIESQLNTISDNQEEMDDNLAIARAELYDLINLTGMPENSDNLGPFSGAYLTDGLTIKEALQQLETAVEAGLGSTALDLSSLTAQIDQLENDLAAETANRINQDAATLAEANDYTDTQIAAIPGADLSGVEADITALENSVNSLQSTDTSLQTQINTINSTTVPAAITSANNYTDTQISSLPQVFSKAEVYEMLGILYYEGFEGTVQGSLSNGASIINIGTNPLEVLSGSKSLYLPHNNSVESFVSSNINIPNISKVNGSCYVHIQHATTVSDGSTPSALLRVYDVTNAQYLQLGRASDDSGSALISSSSFGLTSAFVIKSPKIEVIVSPTTETIRIEVVSNTSNPGYTTVDQLKVTATYN